jgi:HEPN domain-containing protein
MNPLVLEWVDKAEGYFTTASRELRARKAPNYDAACFHAQQCAESACRSMLEIATGRLPEYIVNREASEHPRFAEKLDHYAKRATE